MVAKTEHLPKGANPRFVVTSLSAFPDTPAALAGTCHRNLVALPPLDPDRFLRRIRSGFQLHAAV